MFQAVRLRIFRARIQCVRMSTLDTTVTVRVDRKLRKRLEAAASADQRSVAQFVRIALQNLVARPARQQDHAA
jgi:predicted transcriptional regulator